MSRRRETGWEAAPQKPVEEDQVYLKEYNERLVSKLEQKMLELQELNRAFQENEARINKNYLTQRIINSLFHISQEAAPPPEHPGKGDRPDPDPAVAGFGIGGVHPSRRGRTRGPCHEGPEGA